jgi:hypothetical protein
MTTGLVLKVHKKDFVTFVVQPPEIRKEILETIGRRMVVNYRKRMLNNRGITPSGNLKVHKALSSNYTVRPSDRPAKSPILIDTNRMINSFNVDYSRSTHDRVFLNVRPTRHKFTKLRSDALAAIHHFGTRNGRIPPRPHIGFSKQDARDAGRQFHTTMKPLVGETFRKG